MSNTRINIRIFSWHLKWGKGEWYPTLSKNSHHKDTGWKDGYFRIYQVFSYYSN